MTSGAWGVENNILGVDSDGFWGRERHLNRVLQVCCIFFVQRHNIQGYPDEIREAAHFSEMAQKRLTVSPLQLCKAIANRRFISDSLSDRFKEANPTSRVSPLWVK